MHHVSRTRMWKKSAESVTPKHKNRREELPHFRSWAELSIVLDLWFSSTRSDGDDAAVGESERYHLSWLAAWQQLTTSHNSMFTYYLSIPSNSEWLTDSPSVTDNTSFTCWHTCAVSGCQHLIWPWSFYDVPCHLWSLLNCFGMDQGNVTPIFASGVWPNQTSDNCIHRCKWWGHNNINNPQPLWTMLISLQLIICGNQWNLHLGNVHLTWWDKKWTPIHIQITPSTLSNINAS